MLIGIDAHNLEGQRTGVGRYLYNLLKIWSSTVYRLPSTVKFILYFKDEIPNDLPRSDLFKNKLLKVGSTAKFIHWDLCRAAKKNKVDILFCPGYIAPIFYPHTFIDLPFINSLYKFFKPLFPKSDKLKKGVGVYRGKLALTLHDIIYEVHPKWFEWKSPADKILLKWVSKVSAKKANVIFTPSDFSREEIIKYYKIYPEKVVRTYLSPGGICAIAEIGQNRWLDSGVKKRYGIENRFAFFVGSIFNRRHLPEIISAFALIAKRRSDLQMLIVGKDYTRPSQDIDKLIMVLNNKLKRKVFLRVDFAGDDDLKLLYCDAAFFIYLSDYEGFGLPVLEAMAAGTPVITSDSSSLKEVAGSAALFIENNSDIEEIYQVMEKMIEDRQLRHELTNRGKEQVKKFSWERCAEETLRALLRV